MIQHYTKNPLVPYSAGTAATPIAKIEYHLNGGEHSGMYMCTHNGMCVRGRLLKFFLC